MEDNWIMANVSLIRVNIEEEKLEAFCKKVVLRREADIEEPAEYPDDTVFMDLIDPVTDMYFIRENSLYKVIDLGVDDFAGSLEVVNDEDSADVFHFQGIFREEDFPDLSTAINEAFDYNEDESN